MKSILKRVSISILLSLGFLLPYSALAHEMYVLSPEEIAKGISAPSLAPFSIITSNFEEFMFWAILSVFIVLLIFFISISQKMEDLLDPFLNRLKQYAPAISRITIGLSFIAAGYYQAMFGPEIPLSSLFPGYEHWFSTLLYALGFLMIIGLWTRLAAGIALVLFVAAVFHYGSYLLTYTNYFGEIIVLLLIGSHRMSIEGFQSIAKNSKNFFSALVQKLAPYSFVILRVCFGISLLYASLFAKFIHGGLALEVVQKYDLTRYFPFEPHFFVLGAGIIEIIIALFFIFGIEIRFTAIFLSFWLILSLLYFGEVVWPHLILFGIPLALFFYGYDEYSIEGRIFKTPNREPIF